MGIKWGLFKGNVESEREFAVMQARNDFLRDAPSNPAWMVAEVNNNQIGMLIKSTDVPTLKWFNAPYDSNIVIGDYFNLNGRTWICTQLSSTDDVTLKGSIRECNLLLRFQNNTSSIVERWCFLDKGLYSTSEKQQSVMAIPDKQYVLWIQLDHETEKIYEGKRLAIQKWYDDKGKQVLQVYKVTSVNAVSENFGEGRLLLLTLRSDLYNEHTDSLSEMICDYIPPDDIPEPPEDENQGGGWF